MDALEILGFSKDASVEAFSKFPDWAPGPAALLAFSNAPDYIRGSFLRSPNLEAFLRCLKIWIRFRKVKSLINWKTDDFTIAMVCHPEHFGSDVFDEVDDDRVGKAQYYKQSFAALDEVLSQCVSVIDACSGFVEQLVDWHGFSPMLNRWYLGVTADKGLSDFVQFPFGSDISLIDLSEAGDCYRPVEFDVAVRQLYRILSNGYIKFPGGVTEPSIRQSGADCVALAIDHASCLVDGRWLLGLDQFPNCGDPIGGTLWGDIKVTSRSGGCYGNLTYVCGSGLVSRDVCIHSHDPPFMRSVVLALMSHVDPMRGFSRLKAFGNTYLYFEQILRGYGLLIGDDGLPYKPRCDLVDYSLLPPEVSDRLRYYLRGSFPYGFDDHQQLGPSSKWYDPLKDDLVRGHRLLLLKKIRGFSWFDQNSLNRLIRLARYLPWFLMEDIESVADDISYHDLEVGDLDSLLQDLEVRLDDEFMDEEASRYDDSQNFVDEDPKDPFDSDCDSHSDDNTDGVGTRCYKYGIPWLG